MTRRCPAPTPRAIGVWRPSLLCALLASSVCVACDPAPRAVSLPPSQRSGPALGSPAAVGAISRTEAVGTWSLTDSENELFNVVLQPDGAAVSTWWKGDDGAKGERGRWMVESGVLVVRWTDGWIDAVRRGHSGYEKYSYGPGVPANSTPTSFGQAVKVEGPAQRYSGVWTVPGATAGSRLELFVALRSDGVAMKASDGARAGTWRTEGDSCTIAWADGWLTVIDPLEDGTFFSKSWKPGTSAEAMPTGSGPASRIER
jgi:hypothetical protein